MFAVSAIYSEVSLSTASLYPNHIYIYRFTKMATYPEC